MTTSSLFKTLIAPLHTDSTEQRREFIVNIIIAGFAFIAGMALITSALHYIRHVADTHATNSLVSDVLFLAIIIGLWYISRRGHYKIVTYCVVGLLGLATIQLMFVWSFELPIALLLYTLTIVIGGILLTARANIISFCILTLMIVLISYGQVTNYLHPRTDWSKQSFHIGDAVGYVSIFCIMALISWLANREIDRSFALAARSQKALAAERDNLEIKVAARTIELEEAQAIRLAELGRFAEFGRLSANLLHEVANPLTAAKLNLELLNEQQHSQLVAQAQANIQRLERYIEAARKQIKGQVDVRPFSIRKEINQALRMLTNQAQEADVDILFNYEGTYKLTGNPVKFSQIITNLISNAVEAYSGTDRPPHSKQVEIVVKRSGPGLLLSVQDWGKGIPEQEMAHIFEPFYSTKSTTNKSMGIGLTMIKQFVEKDFKGTITVTSSRASGTCFEVKLQNQKVGT